MSTEAGEQNGQEGSDDDAGRQLRRDAAPPASVVGVADAEGADKPVPSEVPIEGREEARAHQRADHTTRTGEAQVAPSAEDGSEPLQGLKMESSPVSDRAKGAMPASGERGAQGPRADREAPTAQAVARGMNAVLRQGGGSLTMKLSPASLGEVRIEMSMQAGRVSVQFDVGSVAAYEAVKGQFAELRQNLEQRGMTVERVEAHVSPALARSVQSEGGPNQRSGDQPGHADQGQHRHDAADGESRGRADGGERHGWSGDMDGDDAGEADFEQALNIGLDAVA